MSTIYDCQSGLSKRAIPPRWYLLHWLIYHLVLLLILFVVSVVFFSVEDRLRKLLGVVPVMASFFFIYCWSKVGR